MDDSDWHSQETYRSLMLYGSTVIKFVLLVNGGAVIALLTFLGNLVKNETVKIDMAWPMGCFLIGIVVGGLSNVTAYLTQLTLYNEGVGASQATPHTTWLKGTISLAIVGIALFAAGAILALLELRSYT